MGCLLEEGNVFFLIQTNGYFMPYDTVRVGVGVAVSRRSRMMAADVTLLPSFASNRTAQHSPADVIIQTIRDTAEQNEELPMILETENLSTLHFYALQI